MAAFAVVLTHTGNLWSDQHGPGAPALLRNGAAGVDLFFVISGVVMALSSTGSRTVGATTFLRRRLLRIAPLYWLLTLLAAGKVWLVDRHPALGTRADHLPISGLDLVRSLLFVPYRDSAGTLLPVLQVGWTLSFEWLFYVLFALALSARIKPLRLLTPVLTLLALLGTRQTPAWPAWTTLLSPLLLEFLAGIALVELVRRYGPRLHRFPWLWSALGLAGVTLLLMAPGEPAGWQRLLRWGVPAILVVGSAVLLVPLLADRTPRPLLALGDSSYSLYLSHVLVSMAVFRLASALLSPAAIARIGFWPLALVDLVVALAAGMLLYRLVERPMTTALARWTGWNRGRAPLPVSNR